MIVRLWLAFTSVTYHSIWRLKRHQLAWNNPKDQITKTYGVKGSAQLSYSYQHIIHEILPRIHVFR
jgi:hypothetical protein